MDNALLVYNYYALMLAILKHSYSIDGAISQFSPQVQNRKSITAEDTADMIRLKETMTYKAIGIIYGMKADAVYNRIRRAKGIISCGAGDNRCKIYLHQ